MSCYILYVYVILQEYLVKMLNTKSNAAIPLYVWILHIVCPFAMDDDSHTGFGHKVGTACQSLVYFGFGISRKVSTMV